MRVYLDNNIIVSVEKNEIDIADLRANFGPNTEFVYSYIHIQELLEAGLGFDKLKENRLETLRKITKNIHIAPYLQNIESEFQFTKEDPVSVLHTVQSFHSKDRTEIKALLQKLDNNRANLVNALGIDIKRLNNYSENEVIDCINKALITNVYWDLRTFIDCMGLLLHEQIQSIFNILDVIGFWRDKMTEKSNMARSYDASHTYFAAGCNVFVSNDRKCIKKAKVAYSLKNIGTKIVEWNKIS